MICLTSRESIQKQTWTHSWRRRPHTFRNTSTTCCPRLRRREGERSQVGHGCPFPVVNVLCHTYISSYTVILWDLHSSHYIYVIVCFMLHEKFYVSWFSVLCCKKYFMSVVNCQFYVVRDILCQLSILCCKKYFISVVNCHFYVVRNIVCQLLILCCKRFYISCHLSGLRCKKYFMSVLCCKKYFMHVISYIKLRLSSCVYVVPLTLAFLGPCSMWFFIL